MKYRRQNSPRATFNWGLNCFYFWCKEGRKAETRYSPDLQLAWLLPQQYVGRHNGCADPGMRTVVGSNLADLLQGSHLFICTLLLLLFFLFCARKKYSEALRGKKQTFLALVSFRVKLAAPVIVVQVRVLPFGGMNLQTTRIKI